MIWSPGIQCCTVKTGHRDTPSSDILAVTILISRPNSIVIARFECISTLDCAYVLPVRKCSKSPLVRSKRSGIVDGQIRSCKPRPSLHLARSYSLRAKIHSCRAEKRLLRRFMWRPKSSVLRTSSDMKKYMVLRHIHARGSPS